MATSRTLGMAMAGAVWIAGCGGDGQEAGPTPSARGDQRSEVVEVVRRLQTAVLDSDATSYCDALTGDAKRKVVTELAPLGGPTGCEESAERVFDLAGRDELAQIERARKVLKPGDVTIRRRRAVVRLDSGRRLRLSRSSAGWLVSDPSAR